MDTRSQHLDLIHGVPTFGLLRHLSSSPDPTVRDAAILGACRAVDAPPVVLETVATVASTADGRADSWMQHEGLLRVHAVYDRYVKSVLQDASLNPIPHLAALVARPDEAGRRYALRFGGHWNLAVRQAARGRVADASVS